MDFFRGVPEIGITPEKVIHVLLDIVVHIHVRHLPMGLKQKSTLLIEHRFRTKSNHFVNIFRKKCLKRERRVVDTVDIPYSFYLCSFRIKIISENNLNNSSRAAKRQPPEDRRQIHHENQDFQRNHAESPAKGRQYRQYAQYPSRAFQYSF